MIKFSKKDIKFNKIKLIICLLLLLLAVLCTLKIDYVVSADDSQGADVELAQSVSEIVESLNFDELDEVARELNDLNLLILLFVMILLLLFLFVLVYRNIDQGNK